MDKVHRMLTDNGTAIFIQAAADNIYDRIFLSLLERTAHSAQYLSSADFKSLYGGKFDIAEEFRVDCSWFIPNIYGFVLKKK